MKSTAVFTTSSNNYFAFALTLMQSVRDLHDDIDMYFLLVDEIADRKILQNQGLFNLCYVKEIGIPDYKTMAFAYDIVEFNTAVKPFFIKYLFGKGYNKVIYIDPDILVLNRLDAALDALNNHAIVVTPHQLLPMGNLHGFIPYRQFQWEQSVLQRGIFNLGFIGVADSSEGKTFLEWWINRCSYLCFSDPEEGIFVDQKWINLASCFFPSTFILRHQGYNMAVWNLHARRLINNRVNDIDQLVFYHFSSIDINDPDIISKHDKTFKLKDRPDLTDLFRIYRDKVNKNDHDYFSRLPYTYDYFYDGRKIELLERRLYAAVSNNFPDPFNVPSKRFYSILREKQKKQQQSHNAEADSIVIFIMKFCIKTFFRLAGVKRYTKLVRFFRVTDSLRKHTFLID